MNGVPARDSLPKVASGKVTPISEMPRAAALIPVIDPIHPVHPTLAKVPPCASDPSEWYTVTCG